MPVTLVPDALTDAEVTDGIGTGDVGSAARLWVRHWPTALDAARQYVEPAEVPGLAAEALIGTIAAIAVGRGPREDVEGFLRDAVRELGEDDVLPQPADADHPEVFVSPTMSAAYEGLSVHTQQLLLISDPSADGFAEGLTTLQRDYLAAHAEQAPDDDGACQQAHGSLSRAAQSGSEPLPAATWLHLSGCAWCTTALHELSFSTTSLAALVGRPAVVPVPVIPDEPVAAPVPDPEVLAPVAAAPLFADLLDSGTDLEPVAWSDDDLGEETDEDDEDDERPAGFLRSNRGGLVAVVAAAVAAVAVMVLVVNGMSGSSDPDPSAAGGDPTSSSDTLTEPTPTDDDLFLDDEETLAPEDEPSATASETSLDPFAPEATPTPTPTVSASPSKSPTAKPSSSPTQAPTTSTPSAPPSTVAPTPTPTPTRTPTCTLLIFCS